MRQIADRQLTQHFRLYEFIESQMPDEAVALNWKYFDTSTIMLWEILALELEKTRKLINENFTSDLGFQEIGIRIAAGFRCKEWELIRGRSGNSQHTICAADIQPVKCSREMAVKILHFIYSKYNEYWKGGLAIKYPSKQGNLLLIGFVHIDIRGKRARWTYD
jgi:hypothetical protein